MTNVPQGVFPFKLEMMEKDSELTALAGLPLIHELFHQIRLPRLIRRHLRIKEKGFREEDLVETLVSLSIAGGDHLDDIRILEAEKAFQGLIGQEKIASAKTLERFLKKFHQPQEKPEGMDAWVPEANAPLEALGRIHREVVKKLIEVSGLATLTLENDATVIESHKQSAQGTYLGGLGYQPTLGVCAELGLILATEFRDGNVPASFRVKDFFQRCLFSIPKTVKRIRFRGDGAYYDHDLIRYLRLNEIDFTVTAKKTASILDWVEAIPEEKWHDLYRMTPQGWRKTGKQWTEMHWMSAEGTRQTMKERTLRYLITRHPQEQWALFQDKAHKELERKERYEIIATNMDWRGDRLIHWHYEKAGSIEQIHDRLKNDLAGGTLPCAEFGANAAWWQIQCLAWNLVRALQLHALPEDLQNCHLKKLRFRLFNIAGKVIHHARQLILKLSFNHPAFSIYQQARLQIAALVFW